MRWKAPPSEFSKVNFDGAIFKEEDKAGIGVVIQDCQGLVLASCLNHSLTSNCCGA